MAGIEERLRNVKTLEDILQLLTILFTNLNNQNEMYYDIFLNPEPMYVNLERYNPDGDLVTVPIPNVAMMRNQAYSGEGNPNGKVTASPGSLYVDTRSFSLYFKGWGIDSNGWVLLWSSNNFAAGREYLTPSGDGSQLKDLNMNNVRSGILPVTYGGTGVNSITGLIKGNGTNAFTPALDGVDYLGPGILESLANIDLSNLSSEGQAVINSMANRDLSNLTAEGQYIINNKADIDLSNLSVTGQEKLDSKADLDMVNIRPAQSFIDSVLTWCGPDYNRRYSIPSPWTAESDGFIYIAGWAREGSTSIGITIDGLGMSLNATLTNREGGHYPGGIFPVGKGSSTSTWGWIEARIFVPCRGVQ